MPEFTDQMNRKIFLPATPRRIVSVVPSHTELLYDLGLDQEVAGITKFCVHPQKWFRNKTRVGGTKQLNLDVIRHLQPDLIFANKEENTREQIETLANEFPVWLSDVQDLPDALHLIGETGRITGTGKVAGKLIAEIETKFQQWQQQVSRHPGPKPRTVYFIWRQPYMTAGGDTFIHHMMEQAGFDNLFAGQNRYPEVSLETLQQRHCELLLLSSEPFPFSEKHIPEIQMALPDTKILLVDGEIFSWYGSRLTKAPEYFQQLWMKI